MGLDGTLDGVRNIYNWIHEASNEKYWCQLVERLLHPNTPLPDRPNDWGPLPSWQSRRAAAGQQQTNNPPDRDNGTSDNDTDDDLHIPSSPPPSPRPHHPFPPTHHPPSDETTPDDTAYDPKRWLNDAAFSSMVGHSMSHSLTILGLGLGASEMEIKVHYRQLARKYHPDKNNITLTGLTTTEASDFFKLLNNANEYLRNHQ